MSPARPTLVGGIEEYLVALRVERGLSPNTLEAYGRDLAQYQEFLNGREPDDKTVSAYVSSMRNLGLAESSVSRKVAAIRGLHKFLVIEGLRDVDPTAMLAGSRRRELIPKALDIDQTIDLIESPDVTTVAGRRDRAILETLYATGARVSELVGIDLGHIDFDDRTVRVTGKGSKQRVVPLGGESIRSVEAWLPDRMELIRRGQPGDPMFINLRGRRLSRQSVFNVVKTSAASVGLDPEEVSPHVLRHSAATHMVEAGADLRTVQEILGHATISTTQVYTRVSPAHVMEIYVEAHPRSR